MSRSGVAVHQSAPVALRRERHRGRKKRCRSSDLAQAVENDYIGSPCGKLDQTMSCSPRRHGDVLQSEGRSIEYVAHRQGGRLIFACVVLTRGTDRPRSGEIDRTRCAAGMRRAGRHPPEGPGTITCLADIKDEALYQRSWTSSAGAIPSLCPAQLHLHAQAALLPDDGRLAGRQDRDGRRDLPAGWAGLRDDYKISGPELETNVRHGSHGAGVLGERMLAAATKGASGAWFGPESVEAVKKAVDSAYPRKPPRL